MKCMGKVMSVSDEVMWFWFRELTNITPTELEKLKKSVHDGKIH